MHRCWIKPFLASLCLLMLAGFAPATTLSPGSGMPVPYRAMFMVYPG